MRITKELATRMFNKLNAIKRVSKLSFNEAQFYSWIRTIQEINALPEDTFAFQGVALDKWLIITELSDLILPEKISISGSRQDVDLRGNNYSTVSKGLQEYPILDSDTFANISDAIAGAVKATANVVSAVSVRERKLITDVFKRQSRDGKVQYSSESFCPIELNVNFTKEIYFTSEAKDMFIDWFRDSMLSIR